MNRFLEEPELTKESSIMGALGVAGLMHVAPNIGMKALKSTEKGHSAMAGTLAAGVKHGQEGLMLHPNAKSLMEYGVGPETLVDYNVGKRMGKALKKYSDDPARQEVYLNRLRNKFNVDAVDPAMGKEVNKLPIVGSVKRYLDGGSSTRTEKLFNRLAVPETDKMTIPQKAGNLAMLGTAGAAEPTLLLQPAFAAGRKRLAKSELGKKILQKNFDSASEGKEISKVKEGMIDTFVSPGILDTHRLGKFVNNNTTPEERGQLREVIPQILNKN